MLLSLFALGVVLRAPAAPRRHAAVSMCDPFDMNVLKERIKKQNDGTEQVKMIILDAMVPGQRLALTVTKNPRESLGILPVVAERVESGGTLAMVGVDPQRRRVMDRGVEARIASFAPAPDGESAEVTFVGGSCFAVERIIESGAGSTSASAVSYAERKYFDAEIRWLTEVEEACEDDKPIVAAAAALEPLVDKWLECVKKAGRERSAGQLDGVLADLGEMPEAKFASKRALWVCGLINPLPALGVALEVRPGCLGADSALERLQVAHRGIEDSIFRLERDIEGNGPPFAD